MTMQNRKKGSPQTNVKKRDMVMVQESSLDNEEGARMGDG
jgi:hypothetical protein